MKAALLPTGTLGNVVPPPPELMAEIRPKLKDETEETINLIVKHVSKLMLDQPERNQNLVQLNS